MINVADSESVDAPIPVAVQQFFVRVMCGNRFRLLVPHLHANGVAPAIRSCSTSRTT